MARKPKSTESEAEAVAADVALPAEAAADPVPTPENGTPSVVPDVLPVSTAPVRAFVAELKEHRPSFRVHAPGGPRRRAGFGFGRVPVELTWADLAAAGDPDDLLERLQADPMLSVVPFHPPLEAAD